MKSAVTLETFNKVTSQHGDPTLLRNRVERDKLHHVARLHAMFSPRAYESVRSQVIDNCTAIVRYRGPNIDLTSIIRFCPVREAVLRF